MSGKHIRGYCDRPNPRPGERLDFFVSSPVQGTCQTRVLRLLHGDRNPAGPGYKVEEVAGLAPAEIPVAPQFT